MLKNATELRRGAGKPYLVYGQMQKPANLEEIPIINWQYGGYDYEAPAVFDCLWKAPDGRLGLILANWTDRPRRIKINDCRLGIPRFVIVPALGCILEEVM